MTDDHDERRRIQREPTGDGLDELRDVLRRTTRGEDAEKRLATDIVGLMLSQRGGKKLLNDAVREVFNDCLYQFRRKFWEWLPALLFFGILFTLIAVGFFKRH